MSASAFFSVEKYTNVTKVRSLCILNGLRPGLGRQVNELFGPLRFVVTLFLKPKNLLWHNLLCQSFGTTTARIANVV